MRRVSVVLAVAALTCPALADQSAFHAGPAIPEYGRVATVDSDFAIPKNAKLKVRFDVSAAGESGELNRSLESAARFINMHVENGVPLKNIDLAIVVHGGATRDLTLAERYEADNGGAANANAPLIAALLEKNVKVYVCGQSAAFHGVANKDLLPGAKMALSAMTAHALLDAEGYSLNPF